MAEHDDAVDAGRPILCAREVAADGRRDAERRQIAGADDFAAQPFGFAVAGKAPLTAREERVLREHLLLIAEDFVLGIRPHHLAKDARGCGAIRHEQVDHHQIVRLREGQRLQQQRVDEGEDRGVGADAEGERDDRDQGEDRRLDERANRVANVLSNGLHGATPRQRI